MRHIVRTTTASSRRGYTLLELTLVLAILLVLAGLAWPGIQRTYRQHQLQTAVEDVRGHLAACRMKAIDTGLVYQFVYETGGRRYYVLPFEADDGSSSAAPPSISGELGETLQFEDPEGAAADGVPLPAVGRSAGDLLGAGGLSTPILFSPDGTATDASFDVVDDEGQYVRLSVRGLTAAVSVDVVRLRGAR
jgi:prepilin-type N-terminal cleavage/methylation domain-containing protein